MFRVTRFLASLPLIFTFAACGSEGDSQKLKIGEVDTLGERLSDYAASWEGYAEAHEFGYNSEFGDDLYLSIDANGVGHLRVGNAAVAAEATDPDAVYPPSVGPDEEFAGDPGSFHRFGFPSGINYPLHDSGVTQNRLQFTISINDALATWCSLQVPRQDETNGGYMCIPNAPTGWGEDGCYQDIDGVNQHTSCFKLAACRMACDCDAANCTATEGEHVIVDAALEDNGDTLTGTLVYGVERIIIRMTRAN